MTSKLASIALAIAMSLGGLMATAPAASAGSATIVIGDGHGRYVHRDRNYRRHLRRERRHEIRRERRHERRAIRREIRRERRHDRQERRYDRRYRAPHVLYRVN